MKLCRITGSLHATIKNARLEGQRILIAQPLDAAGRDDGEVMLALDQVDAGPGDRVLVMKEGGGARIVLGDDRHPVQCLVIAVVDDLLLNDHEG